MSASAENPQPSVIDQDARCIESDCPHRTTRRHLGCIERCFAGCRIGWQYFDCDGSLADPLLYERPRRIDIVDEFANSTHFERPDLPVHLKGLIACAPCERDHYIEHEQSISCPQCDQNRL